MQHAQLHTILVYDRVYVCVSGGQKVSTSTSQITDWSNWSSGYIPVDTLGTHMNADFMCSRRGTHTRKRFCHTKSCIWVVCCYTYVVLPDSPRSISQEAIHLELLFTASVPPPRWWDLDHGYVRVYSVDYGDRLISVTATPIYTQVRCVKSLV